MGHYGLLGARGIRLSWSARRGKRPLLCWQDSLDVVAPAFIDAGKKKPGLVAQAYIDAGKNKPDLAAPSSTQEKNNPGLAAQSLHRRREKITWPRRPSIDAGKKNWSRRPRPSSTQERQKEKCCVLASLPTTPIDAERAKASSPGLIADIAEVPLTAPARLAASARCILPG
jgi:hypothetical protein